MKRKKLIVFDVDGVLLLSTDKSIALFCKIIREAGLEPNMKIILGNWGHPFLEVLVPLLAKEDNWPDYKTELISRRIEEVFKEVRFSSPSSLTSKLKSLKLVGYKLGIITNRDNQMLKMAFRDAKLDYDLFDFIKTSDDGIYKPDPAVFDKALSRFKPEEIIFVGDSLICDLPAAYSAKQKIDFAAIKSVVHSENSFLEAGVPAELIFDSVISLIDELLICQKVPA